MRACRGFERVLRMRIGHGFDAHRFGDGEFVVALRSGLLRDGKAWVYAGAGIMADSDPDEEYQECLDKARAFRRYFSPVD